MPLQPQTLIELFERASSEQFGLVVETNNPKGMLTKLYAVKGKHYPDLMICVPSTESTVYIVQKSVELD
jgi:hypothetical protein